jgi:hypothetical protein
MVGCIDHGFPSVLNTETQATLRVMKLGRPDPKILELECVLADLRAATFCPHGGHLHRDIRVAHLAPKGLLE